MGWICLNETCSLKFYSLFDFFKEVFVDLFTFFFSFLMNNFMFFIFLIFLFILIAFLRGIFMGVKNNV